MAKKIAFGKNTVGSGKKMQVELKNYERSTHDLSYLWRSTMASGTLVPFMSLLGLPGDTFDIDTDAVGNTHPTVGPLFGSYKLQADIYMCPIRLYQGQLHNNKLGIGMNMANVKLPLLRMVATSPDLTNDPDNQQVNPSSLFAYLGIRGIGHRTTPGSLVQRDFNGVPYLAYWDIYKNYYANKQEGVGAYIHTEFPALVQTVTTVGGSWGSELIPQDPTKIAGVKPTRSTIISFNFTGTQPIQNQLLILTQNGWQYASDLFENWSVSGGALNGSGTKFNTGAENGLIFRSWRYVTQTDVRDEEPKVVTFDLKNIDTMRENILVATPNTAAYLITNTAIAPYGPPLVTTGASMPKLSSQEGLGLKTYQSDIFNNWVNTEWISGPTGVNAISAVSVSGGSFNIDTLNLAKKVYDMLNRIAVSGGSYDDWLDATYSHAQYRRAESPVYMGGLSKEVVFQEVVSNAASSVDGAEQPIGTLAGKGVMSSKKKGGKIVIKVDEPCYIIGIVSLTPRIDYSQGNSWDVNLKTMNDFHKPALDQIGFQDLITDQFAWWDTRLTSQASEPTYWSAGKTPAWMNYMTATNKVLGNFAIRDNEMFMTLNRRYERDPASGRIKDLTTYIDPVKFNHIFAQTSRDAQNFWMQMSVNITARRKMSAKIMPNL